MVRIVAKEDRITLVIEGLPEDEGRVRVNTFLSEVQSFAAALAKIDRETNNGKPASYFEIAELSFQSPVRVAFEARPVSGANPFVGRAVLERLNFIADEINSSRILTGLDADLLEDIRALARPVGKSVKSATVLFNGHELDLTPRVATRVDEALAIEDECEGFIEGKLEQINVHQNANTFHIYPEVGPKKVTCYFPAKLYDDAVAAVGRRVEITGMLKYRLNANFAHQIAVSEIVAFPPENEIPDWDDLRGRAPDATGKLSSEAFVRELRDGWR